MHRWPSQLTCFFLGLAFTASIGIPHARADYPQIRLNTDATTQLQNEQQICVNPTNPENVVACWRDFRLGFRQVGVGTSFDGGVTWTDFLIGGELPWDSDPVLIYDRNGTFYLVVINYEDGGPNQLSVHRTSDGGLSWEGPFTAVYSNGNTFEDKEWIAVDRTGGPRDGRLYITWSRFNDVEVMCVASSDHGVTWSAPVQVSDPNVIGQWSVPIVLRNGNLLVAWDNYFNPRIAYDISTDGGATWGTDRTLTTVGTSPQDDITGGITVFPYPSLALDETLGPRAGWVYCVYPDQAVAGNGMDVWCRRSTDNGNTWSAAVRVNDDAAGLLRDQFHSWVCCDERGILTATWYDRRDDPSNYLWHIYMSRSLDGGQTWEPNVRITTVPSSPGDAGLDGQPDMIGIRPTGLRAGLIGEYSGVSVREGVIHPIWTDTRLGNQDTYASVLRATAGVEDLVAGVTRMSLRSAPNPSSGEMTLHLLLPAAENVTIEIDDAAGRMVRRLPLGAIPQGVRTVEWDGRDEAGRALAAGVYFTRVHGVAGAERIRSKLVLSR
jgi:hypothetical protein